VILPVFPATGVPIQEFATPSRTVVFEKDCERTPLHRMPVVVVVKILLRGSSFFVIVMVVVVAAAVGGGRLIQSRVTIGVGVGVGVVLVADRCLWSARVGETRNNYHTNSVILVVDVVCIAFAKRAHPS
jgi:hypothetical protein